MSEEEIYAGLTDIVREIFGDDTIVLNARTTAPDIKGWDSINNINIIVAAEVRFGVRLSLNPSQTSVILSEQSAHDRPLRAEHLREN